MDSSHPMIITISGNPGSGKSTIAKLVVQKLRYERVYAGGIMRDTAKEQGLTLEQFMSYLSTNPKVEQEIDYKVRDIAYALERTQKNILVEGRVQYHLIPNSIKIYIKVDAKEGAHRILKDLQDTQTSQQRNQQTASTIEEVIKLNEQREETDAQRYQKLYGIDHRIETQYDLVIDTTNITAQQAANKLITYIENREKKQQKAL